MLASLIAGIAGNVILGWIGRRALEIAGWLGVAASIYAGLPPEYQGVVLAILTGHGGSLTIGAALGFAVYIWSQVMSYRSTVRPHVVTDDKRKINLPTLSEDEVRNSTGYSGTIEDRSGR